MDSFDITDGKWTTLVTIGIVTVVWKQNTNIFSYALNVSWLLDYCWCDYSEIGSMVLIVLVELVEGTWANLISAVRC
jgi:hypothetical protein